MKTISLKPEHIKAGTKIIVPVRLGFSSKEHVVHTIQSGIKDKVVNPFGTLYIFDVYWADEYRTTTHSWLIDKWLMVVNTKVNIPKEAL